MPSQLENISLALQGFGAGIQGQLPQFNQMLQNRELMQQKKQQAEQEMQMQRQKTLFSAAQTALNLLDEENYDGLVQFGQQRIGVLSAMGANPEDTQRLTQLAIAARNGSEEAETLLRDELETTVSIGRGMGILETPKRDSKVVGKSLVDPQTGDVIFSEEQPEDYNKPFLSDGSPNPGYQEYEMGLREAGRAETNINLPPTEGEATKSYGKGVGERANARIDQAANAQAQNMSLERMAEALEAGAQTGVGQETLLTLKNMGESLFNLKFGETAGEQEVMKAIQNRLALEIRNPTSGLGLPGSASNKDLDFLTAAVPGLQKTPEGNALLIDYLIKMNDFKQDVAAYQQKIIDDNDGVVPNNIDSQIMRYVNNYSFLGDGDRELIEKASQESEGLTPEEQAEYDKLRRELGVGN